MPTIVEDLAIYTLQRLSPSGVLLEVSDFAERSKKFDLLTEQFDADEHALAYLNKPSIVARLEDDFARCVPALADAAVPLEAWAIPLLSALVGPGAPLLSFGLTVACKLAIAALQAWAKRRLAQKGSSP